MGTLTLSGKNFQMYGSLDAANSIFSVFLLLKSAVGVYVSTEQERRECECVVLLPTFALA